MNFDLALSIDVLARTPGTLKTFLGGLAEPQARGREGPDTFSAFDVVGHLIDGEETDWIPRARIILAKGEDPRFEPFDRFRHRARNVGRSLASLLDEFEGLRAANLTLLRSWRLSAADLDLPGTHPTMGRVTLRELLATWTVHDLEHVAQIARVKAKQYGDQVGPWVPLLPILTNHPVPRSQAKNLFRVLTDDDPPARLPRSLDPVEIRVLGALLEKQQATPEYYPLTLNALAAVRLQGTVALRSIPRPQQRDARNSRRESSRRAVWSGPASRACPRASRGASVC